MNKKYSISQVAKIFNITANKIRYYERQGLIEPTRNLENEYRTFGEKDIIRLQAILLYRSIGLSIKDIKNIFKDGSNTNFLNHFNYQWKIINDEIHRLNTIRTSLEGVLDSIYENEEVNSEKLFSIIEEGNNLNIIKDNWKDKWDFNSWADEYDEDVKIDRGVLKIYDKYEDILNQVYNISTKSLNKDSKILEIGVGTGNLSSKFLRDNYNIVGIDQSREMLRVSKNKYPKLEVRLGEFLKIPYSDKTFDAIVSTYAFHHLNSQEKSLAIKEMMRVLKEDGKIVIGDLMFKDKYDESKILEGLSMAEIEGIKDEYYSYIDQLKKEFRIYGKKLNYLRMNKYVYIIEVGKK